MPIEIPQMLEKNLRNFTGRTWVLSRLMQWYEGSNQRVFLFTGLPGSGKSTLMVWLAGYGKLPVEPTAREGLRFLRGQVKAAHFCRANSRNISPQAFAENIANQLTDSVREFGKAIITTQAERMQISTRQTIGKIDAGARPTVTGVAIGSIDLGTSSDELSFDRGFTRPIKILYENGFDQPILLLIDALDEAELYTGIKLPDLLARIEDLPTQVRILASTRPDPRVMKYFRNVPTLDLITDSSSNNNDDIHNYAQKRLALARSGIQPELQSQLARQIMLKADGIFLYAVMVLDDLLSHRTKITDMANYSLPMGLNGFYHEFFNRELGKDDDRWYQLFKPILGLLAVAQGEGLNSKQLEQIAEIEVEQPLRICRQYLNGDFPEGPFRLFHQSLANFLLEDKDNVDYHIDGVKMHQCIASHYWETFHKNWLHSDDYCMDNLAMHLIYGEEFERAADLLLDYDWMQARLRNNGMSDLVNDYELFPLEEKRGEMISIVKSALRLSSETLEWNGQQLASQLVGRLSDFEQDEIKSLLENAIKSKSGIWLRPIKASLESAGGPLLLIIQVPSYPQCVAVTPDGKYVLSGNYEGELHIWELASGDSVSVLKGHSDGILCVAVTPDGKYVVSGSDDKSLVVWELVDEQDKPSGRKIHRLRGHKEGVRAVAITPDGRYAISGSDDRTLKIWNLENGRVVRTLEGHAESVGFVAVTPDGSHGVSKSYDDQTIIVWDLSHGSIVNTFYRNKKRVKTLSVTADLRYVVSLFYNKRVKVYDLTSGQEVYTFNKEKGDIRFFADSLTPDGRFALTWLGEKNIKVWDLENMKEINTFEGHAYNIEDLVITSDGRLAISASSFDHTLRVWEIAYKSSVQLKREHAGAINSIATTSDGRYAISGSDDGTLKIWDLENFIEVRTLGPSSMISSVAVTSDGRYAVSGSFDNTLSVWDLDSGIEMYTLIGHKGSVRAVDITPDGKYAVSGSDDKTLKIWELSSGREIQTLKGSRGELIFSVEITPNGQFVISGGVETLLKVWELRSGKEVRSINKLWWTINTIKVTPNGRHIIVGSNDGWLRIFDFESGEEMFHLAEGELGSSASEFSDIGSINDVEVDSASILMLLANSN